MIKTGKVNMDGEMTQEIPDLLKGPFIVDGWLQKGESVFFRDGTLKGTCCLVDWTIAIHVLAALSDSVNILKQHVNLGEKNDGGSKRKDGGFD